MTWAQAVLSLIRVVISLRVDFYVMDYRILIRLFFIVPDVNIDGRLTVNVIHHKPFIIFIEV